MLKMKTLTKNYLFKGSRIVSSRMSRLVAKGLAALLFCVLIGGNVVGQSSDQQLAKVRSWQKGPLTWNDFKVVDQSIGAEHSYLEFFLKTEYNVRELDGVRLSKREAVAYVNRALSWVDKACQTPAELRYNQVIFNLAELQRRRMQIELDSTNDVNTAYHMRLLTHTVDSFCRVTNYGYDTLEVAIWDVEVRNQMDAITPRMVELEAKKNQMPKYYTTSRFGMNMGPGMKIMGGQLRHYFRPSGGMYMDFELGYWRNIFSMGFYVGGGKVKRDVVCVNSDNDLFAGERLSVLDLNINYGFAVIDNPKIRLTPFVGYGMNGFYLNSNNEYESSIGPTDGCWRAGLDFKYHLFNDADFSEKSGSQFLGSVNAKVYMTFDKMRQIEGTPKGFTINVQLGVGFMGQSNKVKTVKK